MAVNKVIYGEDTVIDLTNDTLESAEQLIKGVIAHAKDGSIITGTLEVGNFMYYDDVTGETTTKSGTLLDKFEYIEL